MNGNKNYEKTSIVILAYKEPIKFKIMYETLLKHTHQEITPFEIIVIGNNCDKEIAEYLFTHPTYKNIMNFIDNNKNLGTSKGFNFGGALSSGTYICFFNSDYYMQDNWLESMIDCFEHKPCIGLVGCMTNITGNEFEKCNDINSMPNDYIQSECANAQMFTKKEIWLEVGGFNEELYPVEFEDLDFNERIKANGFLVYVNGKCFGFHDHDSSKSNDRVETRKRNRNIFIKKWGNKYPWA